jgi:hypothetical protein
MIKFIKILVPLIFLYLCSPLYSAEVASSFRSGYSPDVGGSMHSGWQLEKLEVEQGIYDINRSADGFDLSTVERPVGFVAAFDIKLIMDKIYFKIGADYNRTFAGGKGVTLNAPASEEVEVRYKQWSVDFPLTFGVTLLFWNETRLSMGGGFAFAYGTYSNSFKSATLDHSASFTSYAFPLVAELSGETFISDNTSIICSVESFYGKSRIVKDGSDYARVDFSGTRFTAGFVRYFNR